MVRLFTTSIGSFPFSKEAVEREAVIERAVRETLRYDIPAMPQLPNPDGGFDPWMTDELRNPGRLVCADEFKRKMRGGARAKIQSVGPATAILNGNYGGDQAIDLVSNHLSALADGLDVGELYIFLDEPRVRGDELSIDPLFLWGRTYGKIRVPDGIKVIRGIHDCNDISSMLPDIFNSRLVDVVAFNAVRYNVPCFGRGSDAYLGYRSRGGRICWGIVDIKMDGSWAEVSGVDFRDGDLISHSCGYANLRETDCGEILDHLNETKGVYLE